LVFGVSLGLEVSAVAPERILSSFPSANRGQPRTKRVCLRIHRSVLRLVEFHQ